MTLIKQVDFDRSGSPPCSIRECGRRNAGSKQGEEKGTARLVSCPRNTRYLYLFSVAVEGTFDAGISRSPSKKRERERERRRGRFLGTSVRRSRHRLRWSRWSISAPATSFAFAPRSIVPKNRPRPRRRSRPRALSVPVQRGSRSKETGAKHKQVFRGQDTRVRGER